MTGPDAFRLTQYARGGCTNEFNGWLDGGTLVPLRPGGFAHREVAEAW